MIALILYEAFDPHRPGGTLVGAIGAYVVIR
jgi:hypothetical protein